MDDRFKFRVWDNEENLFIQEHHFITCCQGRNNTEMELIGVGQNNDYYDEMDIVIQQYTGLKDSEGNLIYEGDIVKLSGEEPYLNNQFTTDYDWKFKGKVQYCEGSYEVISKDCLSIWLYEYINDYEGINAQVLGNIYENPELLED